MTDGNKQQSKNSSGGQLFNTSKEYIDNRVDEELHPALSDPGFTYSPKQDCFGVPVPTNLSRDDDTIRSRQQRFAKALQEYEENVEPKFRTGFKLQETYTWDDVLAQVEVARNEYNGVEGKGNKKSIRNGLRKFSTAAPAIEGWLRLLPEDSVYASVLCGGIRLILGV